MFQHEREAEDQRLGLHGGELKRSEGRRVQSLHHGFHPCHRNFRVLEPPHFVGGGELAVPSVGHPLVQATKRLLLPLSQLPHDLMPTQNES